MDIKIKHSEDLHKFILEWKKIHEGFYHNVIPNMGRETSKNILSMNKLESDPMFIFGDIFYEDLINNHLGARYKKLPHVWSEYNRLAIEYESLLKVARKRIEELLLTELKNKGLEPVINYGYYGQETITASFADQLLLSYIGVVEGQQQLSMQETNYSFPVNQTIKAYTVSASSGPGYMSQIAYATTPAAAKNYMSVFDDLQNSKMASDSKLKKYVS